MSPLYLSSLNATIGARAEVDEEGKLLYLIEKVNKIEEEKEQEKARMKQEIKQEKRIGAEGDKANNFTKRRVIEETGKGKERGRRKNTKVQEKEGAKRV